MARLLTAGRVVRARPVVAGQPPSRARWIVHRDTCTFAPGCFPLLTLVEQVGETGVLARARAGIIARCGTCNPTLIDRTEEPPCSTSSTRTPT